MISTLIMLGLISVLIIAHEMGHFFVARRCGVRVDRFGFGLPFGKPLFSKKIGDVEYCLHWALFGGYVSFADDNPDSPLPADSMERFENQPVWNRFAIAIAGVTVNAILGWVLMTAVLWGWGIPALKGEQVLVEGLASKSCPAAVAGILPGDEITAVDGKSVKTAPMETRLAFVSKTIQAHPLKAFPMTVTHKKDPLPKTLMVLPGKDGRIGVRLQLGEIIYQPVQNPLKAGWESVKFLQVVVASNLEAMGQMIMGKRNAEELSGPIRIVQEGAEMINQNGIQDGLRLAAMISAILAIMNLLPIPALDGGHILFFLIEAIKGSPIRKDIQDGCVQAGFVTLLAFMVFVLWNDLHQVWVKAQQPQAPAASIQEKQ